MHVYLESICGMHLGAQHGTGLHIVSSIVRLVEESVSLTLVQILERFTVIFDRKRQVVVKRME